MNCLEHIALFRLETFSTFGKEDDRIYVFAQGVGTNESIALDVALSETEDDLYVGKINIKARCSCFRCDGNATFFAEELAEIRVMGDSRHEVRWQLPRGQDIDCLRRRLKDGPREWLGTRVWIKEP